MTNWTPAQRIALSAYAPRGLLAARRGRAAPSVACETSIGAVLLADLCGFTRLAAERGREGRSGAEALSAFLDLSLGPLVDGITAAGGDVVAFAGDAVLAVWEGEEGALEQAAHCASERMRQHRGARRDGRLDLPLRIALGAGEVRRLELGGHRDRWVHVVAGAAVEAALRADALRIPDRVIASVGLQQQLGFPLDGPPLDGHVALADPTPRLAGAPAPAAPLDPAALEAFVPDVVVERLAAGPSQFVAEFRTASVAFFGLDPALTGDLASMQRMVRTAQHEIERFGGSLHQIIQDEHGITLVGAFGVPPQSHDDDPLRAVECARALLDALGDLGIRTRAAVATGSMYCGDYGGRTRRHYGVVGDSMNRAAHLMAAAAPGAVVCDGPTRSRVLRRRQLVALPPLELKGGAEPVLSYLVGAVWSEHVPPPATPEVVGRAPLRRALARYLGRLRDPDDRPPLLVMEGDAGLGKTTLLGELHRRALAADIDVVWSQGEAIKERASYSALLPLVRALHAAAPRGPTQAPEAWRPGLLHALLPEEFEADAALEGLPAQLRLERLIALLRAWVLELVRTRPLLWIVEDAHWIDSASQSVLGGIAGSLPCLGVVLAQRPFGAGAAALRSAPHEQLALEPLDRADIGRVLAGRLGVDAVPELLLDIIQRRAAGNPLFAEMLAGVLLERGEIEVGDGTCRLQASERELERVTAPPSLEGLITSRIDRVTPPEQLTLKAASVLGRRFELTLLEAVRAELELPVLEEQLERLVAADFLQAEEKGAVAFRHPLFQEITYGLLTQTQRHFLHRRAAEALERTGAGERPGGLARLALHWEQAGEPARALPLLTRAADQALQHYANEEAIDLYERALTARASLGTASGIDLEQVRIERNIGEAHASLTRHAGARDHFRRALRACGHAVPDGGRGLLGAVAQHLVHRARRRLTGHGASQLSGPARERAFEAMYAMAGLAPVELWLGDERAYAHLALQLSNVGDRLEPSAEGAGGASSLGYLLGLTPFRSAGEHDLRRALGVAERLDPPELRVVCAVMYGMFLTATGRPREAIEVLALASERGASLEGGPWRHRSRFMFAEALLLEGRFETARDRFDEAALLARHGEPHVVGFANALGALARLHAGDSRGALGRLLGDDGVDSTRGNESRLPLFASLGALAEVCALTGLEVERGAAAAREAESLAADWSETASYFAGFFGHAGLLEWWTTALERGQSGAPAHVRLALRRLRRFARRYPASWARLWLFEGRLHLAQGRRRAARRAFARAGRRARRQGLGREQAEAERRLAAPEA